MNYHELLGSDEIAKRQWIVDTLSDDDKEHAHHVLFALQNCYYNINRMSEAIARWNNAPGGVYPEGEAQLKRIIPEGKALHMELPLLIWDYIPLFEFQAFVSNVIRCCNFLAQIAERINKLRPANKTREIDIREYVDKFSSNGDAISKLLASEYESWITDLDKKRDQYLHRLFERQMQGTLNWKLANTAENKLLLR